MIAPEKKKADRFNSIGWTHFTLNFWWGCSEVSPACAHCYAREWAKYRSRKLFGFPVEWGHGKQRGERLTKARVEALTLDRQAKKKGVRYRVFVNSMSDWLDDEVPASWLAFLLKTISMCPSLDFQLLTKRPENWLVRMSEAFAKMMLAPGDIGTGWLIEWRDGKPPSNVWIGTTVENQHYAGDRIPHLLKIPSAVRFLSCEPLLGLVSLTAWLGRCGDPLCPCRDGDACHYVDTPGSRAMRKPPLRIHQVIAGGESGPKARPSHPAWFRSLRDQCDSASVPFYFKQWGEWMPAGGHTADHLHDFMKGQRLYDGTLMLRAGKDNAGAFLEGVEWKQFPHLEGMVPA